MKKLEAKLMEPEARDRRARRTIVRAVDALPPQRGESDHDTEPPHDSSSSQSRAECMLTLAEELGRLAADLFAEGKL